MPISPDIQELVNILIEAQFELVAGELLAEIGAGREVEKPQETSGEKGAPEYFVIRVPIPEEEQFAEAVKFLQLRLVEPVMALAEAERIAGELMQSAPVRIRFVDPSERQESLSLSNLAPGNNRLAQKLDELLKRLVRDRRMRTPEGQ